MRYAGTSRFGIVTALFFMAPFFAGCTSMFHRPINPATRQPQAIARGEVSGAVIPAAPSDHYRAEPGAHFERPSAYPDNPTPAYPRLLLSKRLPPQTVRVRIVVDASGRVVSVSNIEDQSDAFSPSFFDSVSTAVLQLRFSPLVEIRPGPGSTTLRDVGGFDQTFRGKAVGLPFHRDYRFVFRHIDGNASVTVH